MGIRGLSHYIAEDGDLYFKSFELSNSYLVIDGNSIASQLFVKIISSKNNSCYGGDYDEYNKVVKEFFINLNKCNVVPIVLMDGGYERKKFKTILQRCREKVHSLKMFKYGDLDIKLFPIFLTQAFIDVMIDMQILCVKCYFEADAEIASVANALKCPVLSLDSDFYIFDVQYIPFNTVDLEPVKVKISRKKSNYYLKCSIFNLNKFLEIKEIEKQLLPILVALLGNDYVNNSMFELFFNHVIIPKKKISYGQRKIHGLIEWLKKENYDSAIKGILLHLKNKDAQKILKAINETIKAYTLGSVSEPVYNCVLSLLNNEKDKMSSLKIKKINVNWPLVVNTLYYSCKLPSTCIDIMIQKIYFTYIQVEDLAKETTHLSSLNLIKIISEILFQYQNSKSSTFRLYAIYSGLYQEIEFEKQSSLKTLKDINFNNILYMSTEQRQKVLFDILDFQDEDIKTISKFEGDWSIFLLTCIYWVKKNNQSNLLCHLQALLLMAISNKIVQKAVGYFKTYFAFKSRYCSLLNHNQNTFIELTSDFKDFKDLLSNVTKHECVLIQNTLMILREMKKYNMESKNFLLFSIHTFNSFQSCLYHTMLINTLLNYPFPSLKISDFYSGTLLFNLYIKIKSCVPSSNYGKSLLKPAPNIAKIYDYLCHEMCKYTKASPNLIKKKIKVKVKKKIFREYDYIQYSSDDENFSDKVNPFSLLQGIKTPPS